MAASSGGIRAGRAFIEIGAKLGQLDKGLRAAQAKLRKFGQISSRMGMGALKIAAPPVAGFAAALKVFTGFESQMSAVRAVSGATGADFDALTAKAKELGASTTFSAREVAQGMQMLGMAGYDTRQIIAGIPGVLNLAKAGAIELGEAADIASDIGGAFGLAADEIGRISDVLAATATSSNTNVIGLGESFKYAGPLAKAAGQSIEEAAAALGIMGNSGVKASMAGTDLKNMLTVLGKQASVAGVSTQDAAGNVRPLLDVMRDLGEATKGMAGAERMSLFVQEFGERSAKSAIILADANSEIDRMRGATEGAAGSAERMAEEMGDNLGGSIKALLSAAEGAAIAIGEALAPAIKSAAEWLTKATRWVGDFIEENKGIIKTIAAVTAGVAAAGVGFLVLGQFALAASSMIGVLAAAVGLVGAAVGALLSPIGLVVAAIAGIGAVAEAKFGVVSAAAEKARGPIDGLKNHFLGMRDTAVEAFGGIKAALAAGDFRLAAKILWSALKLEWAKGVLAVKQIWFKLATPVLNAATDMKAGLANIFLGIAGTVKKAFVGAVLGVRNFVLGIADEVMFFIKDMWLAIKQFTAGAKRAKEIEQEREELRRKKDAGQRARSDERAAAMRRIDADTQAAMEITLQDAERTKADRQFRHDASLAEGRANIAAQKRELAGLTAAAEGKAAASDSKHAAEAAAAERQKAFNESLAKSFADEAARREAKAAAAGPAKEMAKAGDRAANTATELGTAEAQQAVLDALSGGGVGVADKQLTAAQKQLEEQKKTNQLLTTLRTEATKGTPAPLRPDAMDALPVPTAGQLIGGMVAASTGGVVGDFAALQQGQQVPIPFRPEAPAEPELSPFEKTQREFEAAAKGWRDVSRAAEAEWQVNLDRTPRIADAKAAALAAAQNAPGVASGLMRGLAGGGAGPVRLDVPTGGVDTKQLAGEMTKAVAEMKTVARNTKDLLRQEKDRPQISVERL